MPSSFKKLHDWNENFGTVESILKSFGLWKLVSVLLLAAAVSVWSYLQRLRGPEIVILALATLACALLVLVYLPEVFRPRVKVTLTPILGPAPVQLLTVKNLGAPVTLRAQCTLLLRRNDPNMLRRSTFRMEWDAPKKRAVKLRRGGICNLIVAKAGVIREEVQEHYHRPPEEDQEWMEIVGLPQNGEGEQREAQESSRWHHGDKLPEYDLEITIIGENHTPHVQCFTLRAGRKSAFEMFAISSAS